MSFNQKKSFNTFSPHPHQSPVWKSPAQQDDVSQVQRPACEDQPAAAGPPVPHAAVGRAAVRHRGHPL